MKLRYFIVVLSILIFSPYAQAKVQIQNIVYKGWMDSYRLSSNEHSMVVVTEIGGRVMEYSLGGRNVLWEGTNQYGITYPIAKEWHNYGGFQTWVAPQKLWGWPPDPMMDYGKSNAEVATSLDGQPILRITGAPSLQLGTLTIREFSMNESGEVTVTQRISNISGKTITCGVWGISYMRTPALVAFPVKQKSKFPNGITYFNEESKKSKQFSVRDGICITNYLGAEGLIGADSDGPWMIWFSGNTAYIKLFDPMKKGAPYPNGGCSVQALTADISGGYLEMEIFGPLAALKPGESSESTETWRIQELSQPVRDEAGVVKAIKGMKGKNWIP